MLKSISRKLLRIDPVYAHCDIPCGIYDPYPAQIDAHTIVRMVDLIAALDANDPEMQVKFSRYVATKEEHAEALKNKVRVIWGDFYKPGNVPEGTTDKVWEIMRLASATRQTASKDAATNLLNAVLEFSETFWKIKGVATKRIAAPYPSGGEMVIQA